jgi:hypothetical protein
LTLTSKAKAQYTYAVYGGGTWVFSEIYSDSNIKIKDQFTYLLSKTDQKIRITNYKNFDTSVQLIANEVKIVRIAFNLLSINASDGGKKMHKTVFVESKDPVIINHAPLYYQTTINPDPFIKGFSGSYTVLEKNECGHDYTIYNPNSLSQQTGYGNIGW